MKQVQLFNEAGKSNQISKMYLADAGLSNIRFYLRFMANKNVRALTTKQQSYTQELISDCVSLMSSWISHKKVKEDKISP
jgi:hypothetical protein